LVPSNQGLDCARELPAIPRLTLPNSENSPAETIEGAIVQAVASDIPHDFFAPESGSGFRPNRILATMMMPEAAMNLHDGVETPEHDIRLAWKPLVVKSIS
jgi:hypothetical protein